MRAMPPRRPRTAARVRARAHAALVRDLERLAALAPGGAPERPIGVESPVQVELRAAAAACPLCEAPVRLVEHGAETVGGVRLRVARVRCTACGVARARWFRLTETTQ